MTSVPNQIDLAALLKGQVTVTPEEHSEERAARLKRQARQSIIEDYKGIAVFAVVLVAIVAIGTLAAYECAFNSAATAENQKWAQTLLAALVSGGLSFVLGRKTGRE